MANLKIRPQCYFVRCSAADLGKNEAIHHPFQLRVGDRRELPPLHLQPTRQRWLRTYASANQRQTCPDTERAMPMNTEMMSFTQWVRDRPQKRYTALMRLLAAE